MRTHQEQYTTDFFILLNHKRNPFGKKKKKSSGSKSVAKKNFNYGRCALSTDRSHPFTYKILPFNSVSNADSIHVRNMTCNRMKLYNQPAMIETRLILSMI